MSVPSKQRPRHPGRRDQVRTILRMISAILFGTAAGMLVMYVLQEAFELPKISDNLRMVFMLLLAALVTLLVSKLLYRPDGHGPSVHSVDIERSIDDEAGPAELFTLYVATLEKARDDLEALHEEDRRQREEERREKEKAQERAKREIDDFYQRIVRGDNSAEARELRFSTVFSLHKLGPTFVHCTETIQALVDAHAVLVVGDIALQEGCVRCIDLTEDLRKLIEQYGSRLEERAGGDIHIEKYEVPDHLNNSELIELFNRCDEWTLKHRGRPVVPPRVTPVPGKDEDWNLLVRDLLFADEDDDDRETRSIAKQRDGMVERLYSRSRNIRERLDSDDYRF